MQDLFLHAQSTDVVLFQYTFFNLTSLVTIKLHLKSKLNINV